MTEREYDNLRIGDTVTASDGMRGKVRGWGAKWVYIFWANGRSVYMSYSDLAEASAPQIARARAEREATWSDD